ncbi:MAG: hypothetical protein PHO76_02615 [Methylotenera sp.]|nr:hypothetical protein [Methylotenera sp.]MDD4927236.1 hypothetical protein [Methylotenera sp.]
MDIENTQTVEIKSDEQLASERNLDLSIDDKADINASAENANTETPLIDAQTALKDVLTIVPIGLTLAGLKNAAAAWHDDALSAISSAMLPVLQKYAFGQKMIAYLQAGGGVAEGVLIMALYPVAAATYAGYLVDKELIEKEVNDAADGASNDAGN